MTTFQIPVAVALIIPVIIFILSITITTVISIPIITAMRYFKNKYINSDNNNGNSVSRTILP